MAVVMFFPSRESGLDHRPFSVREQQNRKCLIFPVILIERLYPRGIFLCGCGVQFPALRSWPVGARFDSSGEFPRGFPALVGFAWPLDASRRVRAWVFGDRP